MSHRVERRGTGHRVRRQRARLVLLILPGILLVSGSVAQERKPSAPPAAREGTGVAETAELVPVGPGQEEMILIPAGPFIMGSPQEQQELPEEERPRHTVTLPAFRIDRYEVTNARYARFLRAVAAGHPRTCHPSEAPGKDHTPEAALWKDPEWNAPEKPVIGVDWFDGWAYCAWAGGRLPTEAEWEKAARGSDGRLHTWGNAPPGAARQGNFADESIKKISPRWNVITGYDDGFPHTAPVGSFPEGASPYGVEDMGGNAWEWVSDWFSVQTYGAAPRTAPKGPDKGEKRVLRGGSWDSTPNFLRVAVRYAHYPGYRNTSFGFRCARDVPGGGGGGAAQLPPAGPDPD